MLHGQLGACKRPMLSVPKCRSLMTQECTSWSVLAGHGIWQPEREASGLMNFQNSVQQAAGVQITAYLLAALQQDPSLYLGLQDATLVQNVNAVDTLENTLQVLNPALQLLLQPEVNPSQ